MLLPRIGAPTNFASSQTGCQYRYQQQYHGHGLTRPNSSGKDQYLHTVARPGFAAKTPLLTEMKSLHGCNLQRTSSPRIRCRSCLYR